MQLVQYLPDTAAAAAVLVQVAVPQLVRVVAVPISLIYMGYMVGRSPKINTKRKKVSGMSSKQLLLYLLVLILIAGGLYYFFDIYPQQVIDSHNAETMNFLEGTQFQQAQQSFSQGNYSDAVSTFQNLENQAPTQEAQAADSFAIAISLYGAGNLASSTQEYKMLALNPNNLSPAYPAFALDALGFTTDLVEDNPQVLKAYVYNDQPYSGYLQEANGNFFQADILLFKSADALYPSSYSKYEIAYKEARYLYENLRSGTFTASSTSAQALAQDIQQNVSTGDTLINDPALASALYEAPAMWSQLYLFRAFALDQSDVVLNDIPNASIDSAYDQALTFAEMDPTNAQEQTMNANIRFFYAASLNRRETAVAGNTKRIVALLSYFGTIAQTGKGGLSSGTFLSYVAQDDPKVNPLTSQIAPLSAISPAFENFLKQEKVSY